MGVCDHVPGEVFDHPGINLDTFDDFTFDGIHVVVAVKNRDGSYTTIHVDKKQYAELLETSAPGDVKVSMVAFLEKNNLELVRGDDLH